MRARAGRPHLARPAGGDPAPALHRGLAGGPRAALLRRRPALSRATPTTWRAPPHAYLLIGLVAHTAGGAPLNSAALISPAGGPVSRYDKVNLVPFGEYVPWPFGASPTRSRPRLGDFVAGQRVVVSPVGDHKIGAFICYESVLPNFVRQFAAGGAEVLVQYFQRRLVRQERRALPAPRNGAHAGGGEPPLDSALHQ